MSLQLKGTGVALVTPFNENGNIDFPALEKLINHCISGKLEYLVVLGTTGESATLTKEEKIKIYAFVKEINNGRVPLVYGLGGNNTAELAEEMKKADFSGYSAILSVSPYYNKPIQEGIYQHYKALDAVSPLPIILYNVPGRTMSNMLPETTLRIAKDCKNIIGIKEASGSLEQIMKIIKDKPAGFLVISGDDGITLPIMASGGDGVISVVANSHPLIFSNMVRACLNNDYLTAQKLHYQLNDFIAMLFAEGNPAGVKVALKHLNLMEEFVRLPLIKASENLSKRIADEMKKIS